MSRSSFPPSSRWQYVRSAPTWLTPQVVRDTLAHRTAEWLTLWILAILAGALLSGLLIVLLTTVRVLAFGLGLLSGFVLDSRDADMVAFFKSLPPVLWLGFKAGAVAGALGGLLSPLARWRFAVFPIGMLVGVAYLAVLLSVAKGTFLLALRDPALVVAGAFLGLVGAWAWTRADPPSDVAA
jgi:hypothetical protein